MEDIGDRIKKLRILKGIKQNELAEKIGVSNKRLSNWERGLSRPKEEFIEKICKILEVNYEDLVDMDFEAQTVFNYLDLHGKIDGDFSEYQTNESIIRRFRSLDKPGQEFVFQTIEHEEERMKQLKEQTSLNILSHPVFMLPVSAGKGQFLDSDDFEMHEFPEDKVPKDSTFAVRVSGDSMEPGYPDQSIVFVKRAKTLEPGEIGIFLLNGEGYLKKLGNNNNLISFNPKYKDILIGEYDDLRIVGKVVGDPYLEK